MVQFCSEEGLAFEIKGHINTQSYGEKHTGIIPWW